MAKKFENINTRPVFEAIADATQEPEEVQTAQETDADAERLQEFRNRGLTQGRKGAKLNRINMAFLPDVYDYLRVMSKLNGWTMTRMCNEIVTKHMENNKDVYEAAKKLQGQIK